MFSRMTDKPPSRTLDKIVIRVPDGLRERIAERAKENERSVNAELVDLLDKAYPELTPVPHLIYRMKRIIEIIEENVDEPLSDEFRFLMVHMINTARDHGIFQGESGLADFQRDYEREQYQDRFYDKQRASKPRDAE